jgi:hypothetical protein
MIKYKDFVPQEITPPGFFDLGEHQSFCHSVEALNQWLAESEVKVINIETVVLPNIWNKWEEGSRDASLVAGGETISRWHQFIRCWYYE